MQSSIRSDVSTPSPRHRTTVTFLLIRHGQAEHNVGAETEGEAAYQNPAYRNSRLTAEGERQVRAAGHAIARTTPVAAAVSRIVASKKLRDFATT